VKKLQSLISDVPISRRLKAQRRTAITTKANQHFSCLRLKLSTFVAAAAGTN